MKTLKDYMLFVAKVLQDTLKEGNFVIEKREADADKSEVTLDLVFSSKKCPKRMRVTFDRNGLARASKYYYRRRRKGDIIRITGKHGKLSNSCFGNVELNDGVELGVECVVVTGENDVGDVRIPLGILKNHMYISAKCTELVKAVEESETSLPSW